MNPCHRLSPTRSAMVVRAFRRGINLVEVTLSTVLVGALVLVALQSVGNIGRTWRSTSQVVDGQGLVQELLWEVLAQAYVEPGDDDGFGPESGESNRLSFDDLDDYDGWTESPVSDPSGNPLSGYSGWSRTVVVEKINPSTYVSKPSNSADSGLRCVTVTVTSPTSKTTIAMAYRSETAGTQQALSANATVVTWVGCALQVGTNPASTTGVAVSNHAEDQ